MDTVLKHSHNVLLTSASTTRSDGLSVCERRETEGDATNTTANEGQEVGCVFKDEASPVLALMVQMRLRERTGGRPWWECEGISAWRLRPSRALTPTQHHMSWQLVTSWPITEGLDGPRPPQQGSAHPLTTGLPSSALLIWNL